MMSSSAFVKLFATRNVGAHDRVLRALPSLAIGVLYYNGVIGGGPAAGLAILCGMLLLTSILGSCSIYYLLG